MSQLVVHSVSAIAAHEGPHTIPGIRFRPARAALGVTAWGMNVIELDPHCEGYPEHDHNFDGQEEVYVVLAGRAALHAGEQILAMATGDLVRVPPEVTRKFVTAEEGVCLLAIGATPGQAYDPEAGVG
ncbi:MAG: cupin domain-containing protein [Myxococcota bacterium]